MKRVLQGTFIALMAAEVLVVGQGADVSKILADLRAALGGEKLAAVKTIAIEGRTTRSSQNNTSATSDFEMAFELPDKFMKREVIANMNGMEISRRSGFNGAALIEETDTPMMHGGGGMRIMSMSPGGPMVGGKMTPEQVEAQRKTSLAANKREFARLALGILGTTTDAFPVEFSHAGQAEAADGKADVLEVKGPEGFAARLFIDTRTHLPLMLSWMDKEPLRMTVGGPGPGNVAIDGGGGVQIQRGAGTPEDMARMQQEMAERMKEAEAKRRVVEYRVFYADYQTVNGVKMPARIQRMVDGFATEELALEKIKINQKIDAKKFEAK
jgi:hypothetical protein